MKVTVDSRAPVDVGVDLLALPMSASSAKRLRLEPRLAAVDRASGGQIRAAFASGDFSGKKDRDTPALRRPRPQSQAHPAARPRRRVGDRRRGPAAPGRGGCQPGHDAARRAAWPSRCPAPMRRPMRRAMQALAEGAVLADYRFEAYRKDDENGIGRRERRLPAAASRRRPDGGPPRACAPASSSRSRRTRPGELSDTPGQRAAPRPSSRNAARRMAREVGLRAACSTSPELRRRRWARSSPSAAAARTRRA